MEKGRLTQRQLAVLLGKDRARITRMAGILEEKGIVSLISDKNDRRMNLIYRTKKDRELQPVAAACAKQALDNMTQNFCETEKTDFSQWLCRAIENLKR